MAWREFKKGMNIILIGFMGSGKTEVSKTLSKKLQMEKVEMNDYTLKKSKRGTINEVFDMDGERHWRELEIEVTRELSEKKNSVVATGGGVIYNKIVIDYFRENGFVIYLRTSFVEAVKRLKEYHDRPLFRNVREARKLYTFRKLLYREYSDSYVRTDGKTINEISDEIIEILRNKEWVGSKRIHMADE